MKLWQFTHEGIDDGRLALARCPRCEGEGVTAQFVLNYHGDDLTEIEHRVICGCRQQAMDFLDRANLPAGRFATAALGDLDWEAIQPPRARSTVQRYAEAINEMLVQGLGLTLTGAVGTGKTHVAVGIVRLACALGVEARFYGTPELLARIKATYSGSGETEDDVLRELAEVPLLVLDDLGVERPSDWVRDRLYQIVNQRYVAQRPVIVTANEDLSALAPRLGRRIVSRLSGASIELTFEGQDYRAQARDQLLEKVGLSWADQWRAA